MGFKNRKVLADHGHVALVEVPEGAGGRAASPDLRHDEPAHIPAFLDRDLGDARQWSTARLSKHGAIADHEYGFMIGQRKERGDTDASDAIGLGIETLQDWRGGDPGGPQNRCAFEPLTRDDDALVVDFVDFGIGKNLDAKPIEPFCRLPREGFRKAREDALGAVEQAD